MYNSFKTLIFVISLMCLGAESFSQVFNATGGTPIDLDAGSTNYSSCAAPGNKSNIQFTVSGLSLLSSGFALTEVNIEFDASCGSNLRDVNLYLKSPNGTCMRVYNGAGMATSYSGSVNISLRDGDCLDEPNSSNLSTSATTSLTTSGNFGVFDANLASNLSTTFNGEDPNGVWSLYAFENTLNAPCIVNANLTFGDPVVVDKTIEGDDCVNPIIWQGGPICAATNTKNPSSMMPGSLSGGTTFGTIDGSTCDWNGNNNNDVWIKFEPLVNGPVCISISSIGFNLQSIVVTDANADGDNDPCTYSGPFPNPSGNDPRWNISSCPRPNIYSTTSGTRLSQQHCFNGIAGQSYFLVIDGNGGAEGNFYITGTLGSLAPLPLNYIYFKGEVTNSGNYLEWKTTSEINNDLFVLEKSFDGYSFKEVATIKSKGNTNTENTYSFTDANQIQSRNYYRLKQIDIDHKYAYSPIVILEAKSDIQPYVNYVDGYLHVNQIDRSKKVQITILDLNGRPIYSQENSDPISVSRFAQSVYIVKLVQGNQISYHKINF